MTSNNVYSPEEDSYLLSNVVKRFLKSKKRNLKIVDMGSGSGIQAETCIKLGFNNVLAADINPESIKALRTKNIQVKKSDLFSNIKEKYDLIIFNPPYLPYNKYDNSNIDTSGGRQGYETILRFLKDSKNHLNKNGKILLLFSSLSSPNVILDYSKSIGYKYKTLAVKNLFFEKLYVYIFQNV